MCVDIVDMPQQQTQYGVKDMVMLWWETEDIDPNTNKRYTVIGKFGKTLSPKGRLRPFLESWRGRKFTEAELAGFDLEKLVGANCQLQIVHEIGSTGQEWANIQAIIASPKSAAKLSPSADFVRKKDRQDNAPAEDDDSVPF